MIFLILKLNNTNLSKLVEIVSSQRVYVFKQLIKWQESGYC